MPSSAVTIHLATAPNLFFLLFFFRIVPFIQNGFYLFD